MCSKRHVICVVPYVSCSLAKNEDNALDQHDSEWFHKKLCSLTPYAVWGMVRLVPLVEEFGTLQTEPSTLHVVVITYALGNMSPHGAAAAVDRSKSTFEPPAHFWKGCALVSNLLTWSYQAVFFASRPFDATSWTDVAHRNRTSSKILTSTFNNTDTAWVVRSDSCCSIMFVQRLEKIDERTSRC